MIRLFTLFELYKFPKYFRTRKLAKIITTTLFLVVFGTIAFGIYWFFNVGLTYISLDVVEDLQMPLLLFLYEIFFLILSIVILLSAFLSTLFNLFKGAENSWIVATPGHASLPRFVYVKSIIASLLPFFILFIPAILAFTHVFNLPWYGVILIVTLAFALLLVLHAITALFILSITTLYNAITKYFSYIPFSIKGLILFVTLLVGAVLTSIWKMVGYVDLVKLFRAEETEVIIELSTIANHFLLLPSHPFAMFLIHFQFGNFVESYMYLALLILFALIGCVLWWYLAPYTYPLWKRFQEGSGGVSAGITSTTPLHGGYKFMGNQISSIYKKELLISLRNARGLIWFAFLFGIWVLQILASISLNKNVILYQTDLSPKMISLQVLQFVIALYFIASFTLRFVFPTFSMEKKTRWILGTAPIAFRKLFFGKYFFYSSVFLTLGIIMGYISVVALQIALSYGLYLVALFGVGVVFLVTLALSLGALYPSFETDDPEVISTSMPGLLFTGLALLYGGLGALVLRYTLTENTPLYLTVFSCISLVFIVAMLHFVPEKARRYQMRTL